MKKIKKIAIKAAREAGSYAFSRVGKIREILHKKGHTDLVTDVDKHCERLIIARIRRAFPGHSIIAEESGTKDSGSEICWVIDPLDGTTNYTHGFGFYCTSIGVMVKGEVRLGVIYDPTRKELFFAEKDKGAFLNGEQIFVSGAENISSSLLATGFPYNAEGRMRNMECLSRLLGRAQAVRRAGSAALDLSYVACGRFDGFWEFNLSPWDTAAGQLIVTEAGGRVTRIDGSKFDIFEKEIVATNSKIHSEILALLGP